MLELVDLLVGVASNDHTPPVTRQTALYGVKLLTRRLAGKYDQWFIKVCAVSCTCGEINEYCVCVDVCMHACVWFTSYVFSFPSCSIREYNLHC